MEVGEREASEQSVVLFLSIKRLLPNNRPSLQIKLQSQKPVLLKYFQLQKKKKSKEKLP